MQPIARSSPSYRQKPRPEFTVTCDIRTNPLIVRYISIYPSLGKQQQTGERTKTSVQGRRTKVWAVTSENAWRQIMRIRRNILAPAILTIGTIGSLVAGPVLALTSVAAPAGTAVAVGVHSDVILYHT